MELNINLNFPNFIFAVMKLSNDSINAPNPKNAKGETIIQKDAILVAAIE